MQVWAAGSLGLSHERLLAGFIPYLQHLLAQQHPVLHPADVARLAWGAAALAAKGLLPPSAHNQLRHFWALLVSAVSGMLQAPPQPDIHALFKAE